MFSTSRAVRVRRGTRFRRVARRWVDIAGDVVRKVFHSPPNVEFIEGSCEAIHRRTTRWTWS